MEINIEHLKFIQSVISRLNTNSFMIKGWSITVISAFLALYANSGNYKYILSAIFPTIIFWFIDTYYLQQERKFKSIYNDVAGLTPENSRILVRSFEMPIDKYIGGKFQYHTVFLSKTIWPFYAAPIMVLAIFSKIVACQ
jgi:hypothetical protein